MTLMSVLVSLIISSPLMSYSRVPWCSIFLLASLVYGLCFEMSKESSLNVNSWDWSFSSSSRSENTDCRLCFGLSLSIWWGEGKSRRLIWALVFCVGVLKTMLFVRVVLWVSLRRGTRYSWWSIFSWYENIGQALGFLRDIFSLRVKCWLGSSFVFLNDRNKSLFDPRSSNLSYYKHPALW